ncbi:MAG: DUF2203 family protein [Pirellulaceae bacterium]
MMNEPPPPQTIKRFTLEEAEAMLPLVRSIVSDICDIFRNVTGRRADLHRLLRMSTRTASHLYTDEVAESRADLQEEYDRIWQYREELESLGVLLRQPEVGYIEFPTVLHGRDGFFSWQLGEATIQYCRHADAPSTARTPLRP